MFDLLILIEIQVKKYGVLNVYYMFIVFTSLYLKIEVNQSLKYLLLDT
jgi:hypothetical protein